MFNGMCVCVCVCVCICTCALYSGTDCKAQKVVVAFALEGIGNLLSSWAQLSLTMSSSLLWTEVIRKWVVQGCRLQEQRHKPHDSNIHFSSKGLWMSSSPIENWARRIFNPHCNSHRILVYFTLQVNPLTFPGFWSVPSKKLTSLLPLLPSPPVLSSLPPIDASGYSCYKMVDDI